MKQFDWWEIVNAINDLMVLALMLLFLFGGILTPGLSTKLAGFFGATFWLMQVVCTHTIGDKFDKKFKDTMIKRPFFASTAVLPASVLVKMRMARAMAYVGNIVHPSYGKKNRTQRLWFQGYDFRQDCTFMELLYAYTLAVSFILMWLSLLLPQLKKFF